MINTLKGFFSFFVKNPQQPLIKDEKPLKSFSERLSVINADPTYPLVNIVIPETFTDSIHNNLMNNPIIIDKAGNRLDYSQIEIVCPKNNAGHYLNPYTNYSTPIVLITDDFIMPAEKDVTYEKILKKQTKLKQQMELFVSLQEEIYLLFKTKQFLGRRKHANKLKLSLVRNDIENQINLFISLVIDVIWGEKGMNNQLQLAEEIEILTKPRNFLEQISLEKNKDYTFKRHMELNQMLAENVIQCMQPKENDANPKSLEKILSKATKTQIFGNMAIFNNQKDRTELIKKMGQHGDTNMKEFPIQKKLRKYIK